MWPDPPSDYVNDSAIASNYRMARLKILPKVQQTPRMIRIQGRKSGTHDALTLHHSADSLIYLVVRTVSALFLPSIPPSRANWDWSIRIGDRIRQNGAPFLPYGSGSRLHWPRQVAETFPLPRSMPCRYPVPSRIGWCPRKCPRMRSRRIVALARFGLTSLQAYRCQNGRRNTTSCRNNGAGPVKRESSYFSLVFIGKQSTARPETIGIPMSSVLRRCSTSSWLIPPCTPSYHLHSHAC